MRFLKRLFITLIIISGLIALGASLISYYYQNEVKQYVKARINDLLESPVDVNSIDFSVLSKFPNASISLSQVLAWDAFPDVEGTDTLFYADKIYFEFNLFDLIRSDYQIKHIEVFKADVNLRWNKNGENNYVFWKVNDNLEEKQSDIDLESVMFTKCRLTLDNRKVDFRSWYIVDKLEFEMHIEDEKLVFDIQLLSPAFAYRSNEFDYESKLLLDLETKMNIDNAKNEIIFKEGTLTLGSFKGEAIGKVDYEKGIYDFNLNTARQKLEKVLPVIPKYLTDKLKGYNTNANIELSLITGKKQQKEWRTRIDFNADGGKISHNHSGITIDELAFEGDITLASSVKFLKLNHYSGVFSGSTFNGELMVKNFKHPRIDLQLNGLFDLSRMLDFMEVKNIESVYGKADVDFRFIGQFEDPENIRSKEIERAITNGKLVLNDLGFSVPSLNMKFDHLNGEFILDDNDATINNLTGTWKGAESKVNGSIRNLMPFILFKDQKLFIRATGEFDHIRLETFFTSESSNSKRETFQIPCFLDMEIESRIAKLTYKKFEADDLYGAFEVSNCKIKSDNFGFRSAGGKLNGNLVLSNSSEGQMNLLINSYLNQIDIDKLFNEFDNFGQKLIKHNQIRGKLNADIYYKGSWDRNLILDPKSIEANVIINIDNGELIELESLMKIGIYLKQNPLTSTIIDTESLDKKLNHIYFQQLSNRIEIKNEVIYIPEMTISSSALDINLAGTHHFDNRIDYKMNFRLQQLIKQRKETEFGMIEDDGSGMRIFMSMTGTSDNPIFSMDKTTKKSWRKDNWKKESENISTILNKEIQTIFGDEKDTLTFNEYDRPLQFELEWDVEEDTTNILLMGDTLKNKPKKFILESDEDIRDSDDDDY